MLPSLSPLIKQRTHMALQLTKDIVVLSIREATCTAVRGGWRSGFHRVAELMGCVWERAACISRGSIRRFSLGSVWYFCHLDSSGIILSGAQSWLQHLWACSAMVHDRSSSAVWNVLGWVLWSLVLCLSSRWVSARHSWVLRWKRSRCFWCLSGWDEKMCACVSPHS